eukprot:g16355.t1
MSVGWHSDDESLFQGKLVDIRILSLSLGARRKFELRANWPEEAESTQPKSVMLSDGDMMTMEGMTQKHFQHRVPKEGHVDGPRINLTWRWTVRHTPRWGGDELQALREFLSEMTPMCLAGSAASLPLLDEAELDGEILIEAPPEEWDVEMAFPENEKPRKKKKAKTVDPAALAAHRVWKRLRAERKAAKKAKRREEAKARKRRGYGADLEGFLVKTQERLEQRAAEAEAAALLMAQTAQTSAPVARATGSDLRSFILKTRERLAEQAAVAKAAQRAKEAKAAALAASVDLDTFRKECQARIAQKLLSKIPQVRTGQVTGSEEGLFQRRKIAIVGAGPAGLWAAMLLAQKEGTSRSGHGLYRWTDPSGMLRPRPDAPEIVVMEARSMANHCTRTDIRIALSSSTRSMLDQQTRSRSFTSGMPVAEIEEGLLQFFALEEGGRP